MRSAVKGSCPSPWLCFLVRRRTVKPLISGHLQLQPEADDALAGVADRVAGADVRVADEGFALAPIKYLLVADVVDDLARRSAEHRDQSDDPIGHGAIDD